MLRFLLRRLLQAALALLAVSAIVFLLSRVTGNPVDTLLPIDATPADRAELSESLGLNQPLLVQYGTFVSGAIRGDFGVSVRTGRPVTELVADRIVNSVILTTAIMLETIVISVPLGVIAAVFRGQIAERLALTFSFVGQSIPSFWTGLVAMGIFAVQLRWLPTSGMGSWQHIVLPSVVTAWFISAGLVRLLRSSMLEVLDSDYIRVARGKGLRESVVVVRHALPNALVPVLTYLGMMYGIIVGAAITTEVVFSWPGLGSLTYRALLARDFPVLQFAILAWTAMVLTLSLLVDALYVAIDPRIKVQD